MGSLVDANIEGDFTLLRRKNRTFHLIYTNEKRKIVVPIEWKKLALHFSSYSDMSLYLENDIVSSLIDFSIEREVFFFIFEAHPFPNFETNPSAEKGCPQL